MSSIDLKTNSSSRHLRKSEEWEFGKKVCMGTKGGSTSEGTCVQNVVKGDSGVRRKV